MRDDTIDGLIVASRPTDADITAQFSAASQRRILEEVLASDTVTKLPPRRHARWPWLVAAGIFLAIGALTVQALLPSRTTTVVTRDPSGGITTTTVTKPPVGLPVAMALEPLAQQAAQRPALTPVGKNSYYHLVTTSTQVGESPGTRTVESYVASDGWTWKKAVEPGLLNSWNLYDAKVEDYSTLPTDPVALDALLRRRTGNNSADERVFKAIDEILMSQTAPPVVKAAAIRVLDRMSKNPQAPETTSKGVARPKITLEPVTVSGRSAIRVTQTDPASRPGVSFSITLDTETGDMVENGSTSPGGTYAEVVMVRELVTTLPTEFVSVLGTVRVEKEIWR